jgi:hypothetical protein
MYRQGTIIPFSRYKKSLTYTANTVADRFIRDYIGIVYTSKKRLERCRHALKCALVVLAQRHSEVVKTAMDGQSVHVQILSSAICSVGARWHLGGSARSVKVAKRILAVSDPCSEAKHECQAQESKTKSSDKKNGNTVF